MNTLLYSIKRYCLHILAQQPVLFTRILWFWFLLQQVRSKNNKKLIQPCCLNKEWKHDFAIVWNTKKKHWISWIARLHNSESFLSRVIISWLDVFDEIVLIDNHSTDNTARICETLVQQYPWKILFLQYPFAVAKPYSVDHINTDPDSLHSLVYFYNRCFSQATYAIVCKIDDDNILIPELCDPHRLRATVLQMKKNDYYCFWWYNVVQQQGTYNLLPIQHRYSWLIGDIWFYYNTEERYFFKDTYYEKLNKQWLKMTWLWMVYIHAKYLKRWAEVPESWKTTYDKKIARIMANAWFFVQQ